MTYEGIEFTIRAGLGRNEWTLLITYPDRAEPFVTQAISVGQISRLRRREFIMLLRRRGSQQAEMCEGFAPLGSVPLTDSGAGVPFTC